jgi:hypothetical protein
MIFYSDLDDQLRLRAGVIDFRELFNERFCFETVVDLRFIALIDDIQFSQIFLERQRFDCERHRRLIAVIGRSISGTLLTNWTN